jgi:WD40 repeat protein
MGRALERALTYQRLALCTHSSPFHEKPACTNSLTFSASLLINTETQKVVKTWAGHETAVNKMVVDEDRGTIITASGSGNVKLWSLNNMRQIANFEGVHARSTFSVSGVVDMALVDDMLYVVPPSSPLPPPDPPAQASRVQPSS